jgi:hypothetical protein
MNTIHRKNGKQVRCAPVTCKPYQHLHTLTPHPLGLSQYHNSTSASGHMPNIKAQTLAVQQHRMLHSAVHYPVKGGITATHRNYECLGAGRYGVVHTCISHALLHRFLILALSCCRDSLPEP